MSAAVAVFAGCVNRKLLSANSFPITVLLGDNISVKKKQDGAHMNMRVSIIRFDSGSRVNQRDVWSEIEKC